LFSFHPGLPDSVAAIGVMICAFLHVWAQGRKEREMIALSFNCVLSTLRDAAVQRIF
tara:strand:+ start:145 stop:315 length:171 start_codon:yes stop_codon:yes gene_type:complete